jgi:hypothetical protein
MDALWKDWRPDVRGTPAPVTAVRTVTDPVSRRRAEAGTSVA